MAIEEQPTKTRGAIVRLGRQPAQRSRSAFGGLILRLFQPVDNASVTFFRIAFGLTSFFHIWGVLDSERIRRRYIDTPFLFSFPGLDWVRPLPGELLLTLWFALAAASVLIMLGWFYKPAIVFFFIGHTYAIHLDQSIFWNHYYVVTLFAFLMIFVPANRAHSLDVMWRKTRPANTVPAWALWILRAQMGITYFFAGVAKINSDWLDGRPMNVFLQGEDSFPFISPLFNEHWMHVALSWVGIVFDLSIVFLLLWHRTRVVAFVAVLTFHLINSLVFDIEVFPWFAIAATTLFFAPDWPRRFGIWNGEPEPRPEAQASPRRWAQLRTRQKAGFVVLAIYFIGQVMLPLRHYAYPGDVNWTTEGDLWAWRMLIVDAEQDSVFVARSQATGYECRLHTERYVALGQIHKLGFRPDMMAQFGHHIADLYWQRERERVSVHVYSKVSINGHAFAALVSPETDLAGVDRALHNDWVLPEEPPTPPVAPPPLPVCDL